MGLDVHAYVSLIISYYLLYINLSVFHAQ